MDLNQSENQGTGILSVSTLVGGSGANCQAWQFAIKTFCHDIKKCIQGRTTPLKLDLAFHIPGNMLKPDFYGVRTGSYFKKMSILVVQIALPDEFPENALVHIRHEAHQAIDESVRWAAKNHLEFDALLFHQVVYQCEEIESN